MIFTNSIFVSKKNTVSLDYSIVVLSSCNFRVGIVGGKVSSISSLVVLPGVFVLFELSE